MPIDRRSILSAGLGAGIGVGLSGAAAAANAGPRPDRDRLAAAQVPPAAELGLKPGAAQDQSVALQAAIDAAASRGAPLLLPPGRFRVGKLDLRPGTRMVGTARATILEFIGGALLAKATASHLKASCSTALTRRSTSARRPGSSA